MSVAKYYTIFLLILTGVLIHQVLLPLYSGEGSFLYQPLKGYAQLKQDMANYDASLKDANQLIAQAKDLQAKYDAIAPADLDLMKIMVPDSISEVKLHSEMTSILTQAGFPPEKLAIGKTGGSAPPAPGLAAFSVSFSLEDASYERLKSFLRTIEHSKRILAIKSISVSPGEKVGDAYKFDISADTYYVSAEKQKTR